MAPFERKSSGAAEIIEQIGSLGRFASASLKFADSLHQLSGLNLRDSERVPRSYPARDAGSLRQHNPGIEERTPRTGERLEDQG